MWPTIAFFVLLGIILMAVWITRPHVKCHHPRVRCVHGDEIVFAAGGRRVQCLDCGRYIDAPLPRLCSVTGRPHQEER